MAAYCSELIHAWRGDGTAVTAAAQTSLFTGAGGTGGIYTLPSNFFNVNNKTIRLVTTGRISNAVTTPGTARFAVQFGSTVSVFDSLAINLNIVAKTNVNWTLDLTLICQAQGGGTVTALFPVDCKFTSEAVVGSPLPTVGGCGVVMLPYNTAPAVGAGFDATTPQKIDILFTQTVATGSIQTHSHQVFALN